MNRARLHDLRAMAEGVADDATLGQSIYQDMRTYQQVRSILNGVRQQAVVHSMWKVADGACEDLTKLRDFYASAPERLAKVAKDCRWSDADLASRIKLARKLHGVLEKLCIEVTELASLYADEVMPLIDKIDGLHREFDALVPVLDPAHGTEQDRKLY